MSPRCGRVLLTGNICTRREGHTGRHNVVSPEALKVDKVYRQSPRGRAVAKAYRDSPRGRGMQKAWLASPTGRTSVKVYTASPKRRAGERARLESPQGRASQKTRRESPKGREHARAGSQKRRARKLDATIDPFTTAELSSHIEAMGGRCVYCNGPYEHLDHVYPLSAGGPHTLYNLVPSCAKCNRRKGNMLPLQWLLNTNRSTI